MLELRPNCECCNRDLPPRKLRRAHLQLRVHLLRDCVAEKLGGICPNCGGGFVVRPIRPAAKLANNPPSSRRSLETRRAAMSSVMRRSVLCDDAKPAGGECP